MFRVSVADESPLDRAVMGRSFSLLYGAGAMLVLASLLLVPPSELFLPGMLAPPIIAYGVVALLLLRAELLPIWAFQALPPLGAILVTMLAYSAGNPSFHAYALIYAWVIVSAFYFFAWREALPSFVLAAAGYAGALLHHDDADDRVLFWVMGAGTLLVTSVLLAQLRDRIDRLVQVLRGSDSLKTTIIRSVSHDFRTPLTAIIAAGESSASPNLDPETRREVSSLIVTEASRLSETLAKLLDMSKLEAGAATPYRTMCSIEEVIDAALEHTPYRERFDVEADSPPAVWVDAAQLERAFSNILENASRFAGHGLVRIVVEADDHRLFVRITDNGPGLAARERDLIFEPFYHGPEEGGGHRGPGLGLAIARGFIETNGGRIWAESRRGKGTTFVIELPLPDER